MNSSEAQKVIESLRMGIPPDGYVRELTVGRKHEIDQLTSKLESVEPGSLLIRANFGSGKSHLLRFIRETALQEGYAVSSVTLDAKSAVRFNRMDQVLGAIWRGLEVPGSAGQKGVRPFFNLICQAIEKSKAKVETNSYWCNLTDKWRWGYSEVLEAPAVFVALRAWATADPDLQRFIEAWFYHPWKLQSQRRVLYQLLVENLRSFFRDPRSAGQFYLDDVFVFNRQGYHQSWTALRDIHNLSLAAGLKGAIILFDEFEDVLKNLNNITFKQAAFWNLFTFFAGKRFPGMTFYAVTPEFVHKCKKLLMDKGYWDYDYSQFEALPTFQMSPLENRELEDLAMRIMKIHGIAYEWEPDAVMKASELRSIVRRAASVRVEDRARHTIREVVKALDRLLEGE